MSTNSDNFNIGLFGIAALAGIAAIGAALDDATTPSVPTRRYSAPSITPSITPNYDRNTSYDPYTGRTTEQIPTQRRVDPRAYEVPPMYQPGLAEGWLQKNQRIPEKLQHAIGFIDDGQMYEIAERAARLGNHESLIIYIDGGRLYVVDSAMLKRDANAKNQLKSYFNTRTNMKVGIIRRYTTTWNFDWHYASLVLNACYIY